MLCIMKYNYNFIVDFFNVTYCIIKLIMCDINNNIYYSYYRILL